MQFQGAVWNPPHRMKMLPEPGTLDEKGTVAIFAQCTNWFAVIRQALSTIICKLKFDGAYPMPG